MKRNEMHFYQLLRDYLTDYLITKRNFSDKTVRTYRQSINLLRLYLRDEKNINFDQIVFLVFLEAVFMIFSFGSKIIARIQLKHLILDCQPLSHF